MADRTPRRFEDIAASLMRDIQTAATLPAASRRSRLAEAAAQDTQEDAAPAARPDLSDNFFFKTMQDDTLTEKKKITTIRDKIAIAVADPLTQKDADIKAANKIFADFEAYYTHLQDDAIDTDMQSIKQLMDRIKNSIAPKMKEMIDSLTGTNTNIKECRDLLDVVKTARLLGTTIEELQAAVRRNAQLEKDIGAKKADLAQLEADKKTYDDRVDAAAAAITAQSSTRLGSISQSVFGVPKGLATTLTRAETAKKEHDDKIVAITTDIATLDGQRQKELDEKNPLKILRTFDMTQNGLKDQIEKAAQDVINVVDTVRSSVRTLLDRVAKSEEAMSEIVAEIGNTRIDRTMLISALNDAYHQNQNRADTVGDKVKELETSLTAANDKEKDSVEAAQIQVDLITQSTNHSQTLAYGERVNRLLQSMKTSDATSVLATNDAERITDSVKNNKEGLNSLYNHTLPAVSTAMKLVLHQFVDEQDQEFRLAITEVTKSLGQTAQGTAERALEQQQQFQEAKIAGLNSLIDQLDSASDLLTRSIEQSVRGAIEEGSALSNLSDAAGDLRKGVGRASEVQSEVRDALRRGKVGAEKALAEPAAPGAPPVAPSTGDNPAPA